MTRELLNSVVGLTVKEAEEKVHASKHETWVVPEETIMTSIARPNLVILYEKDGKVVTALAGDPVELD